MVTTVTTVKLSALLAVSDFLFNISYCTLIILFIWSYVALRWITAFTTGCLLWLVLIVSMILCLCCINPCCSRYRKKIFHIFSVTATIIPSIAVTSIISSLQSWSWVSVISNRSPILPPGCILQIMIIISLLFLSTVHYCM